MQGPPRTNSPPAVPMHPSKTTHTRHTRAAEPEAQAPTGVSFHQERSPIHHTPSEQNSSKKNFSFTFGGHTTSNLFTRIGADERPPSNHAVPTASWEEQTNAHLYSQPPSDWVKIVPGPGFATHGGQDSGGIAGEKICTMARRNDQPTPMVAENGKETESYTTLEDAGKEEYGEGKEQEERAKGGETEEEVLEEGPAGAWALVTNPTGPLMVRRSSRVHAKREAGVESESTPHVEGGEGRGLRDKKRAPSEVSSDVGQEDVVMGENTDTVSEHAEREDRGKRAARGGRGRGRGKGRGVKGGWREKEVKTEFTGSAESEFMSEPHNGPDKKPRLKRTRSNHTATDEEDPILREEAKKLKNREASKQARQRRKDYVATLQGEHDEMEQATQRMQAHIKQLREENARLRQELQELSE